MPCSVLSSSSCSTSASRYTACPLPIGTVESKITMPACGRSTRLREWRASGFETQKNRS